MSLRWQPRHCRARMLRRLQFSRQSSANCWQGRQRQQLDMHFVVIDGPSNDPNPKPPPVNNKSFKDEGSRALIKLSLDFVKLVYIIVEYRYVVGNVNTFWYRDSAVQYNCVTDCVLYVLVSAFSVLLGFGVSGKAIGRRGTEPKVQESLSRGIYGSRLPELVTSNTRPPNCKKDDALCIAGVPMESCEVVNDRLPDFWLRL